MASNLDAAKNAIKQLQPKKLFKVRFVQTDYYSVEVEAHDEDEAEDLGREEWENDNIEHYDSDFTVENVEEID